MARERKHFVSKHSFARQCKYFASEQCFSHRKHYSSERKVSLGNKCCVSKFKVSIVNANFYKVLQENANILPVNALLLGGMQTFPKRTKSLSEERKTFVQDSCSEKHILQAKFIVGVLA